MKTVSISFNKRKKELSIIIGNSVLVIPEWTTNYGGNLVTTLTYSAQEKLIKMLVNNIEL